MPPIINNDKNKYNDYLKTRVESLGLSVRTEHALINASIRTIGGILRKNNESLMEIRGLGQRGLDEINLKIKKHLEFYESIPHPTYIAEDSYNVDVEPEKEGAYFKENTDNHKENNDIIGSLVKHFNIDEETVLSKTRKQKIVAIRNLIVYFLREYAEMSFPAIGKLLGGRDHTTMIHSYNKVLKDLNSGKSFEWKFPELIKEAQLIKDRKNYVESTVIPGIVDSTKEQILSKESELIYRDISERNMKVLDLYREGITLENIAKTIGVTRERIRQIAENTIKQIAINDSISKNIIIDTTVMVEEEKRKRSIRKKGDSKINVKTKKEKRWSRYYASCRSCGTVSIPHVKKGLCEKCIGGFREDRREQILNQHDNKCESCGLARNEAIKLYKRDFYITKDKKVLCRGCFLKKTGKKLGSYKNYEWSRFFPECKSCGTKSIPHSKNGLCRNCDPQRTKEDRENAIIKAGSHCFNCNISREDAQTKFGRDLYVTKTGKTLCRICFQQMPKT